MLNRVIRLAAAVICCVTVASCLAPGSQGILPEDLERFEVIPERDADCNGFQAEHQSGWDSEFMIYDSMKDAVEAADIVAVTTIDAILPARYWTPTGARPDDPDDHGMAIFRPVVLRIDEVIRGDSDLAGLVVAKLGGCDRRAGFAFESSPERISGEPGDRVLVFAESSDNWASDYDWGDDLPGWYIQLQHAAEIRSVPSERVIQAVTENWIRDDRGMAEGFQLWSGSPTSFEGIVEQTRALAASD